MFGGHSAVTEKADVMNDTKKYDIAYIFAILYTYLITLPNGIATYRSYGSECQSYSNRRLKLCHATVREQSKEQRLVLGPPVAF